MPAQLGDHFVHPGAALERVVQRLVVRAVDAHEIVDVLRRERAHLRLETRPADRRHQLLLRNLAREHGARRVAHRGKDHPAGVDDSAVEIEEDDREPHASIVAPQAGGGGGGGPPHAWLVK